MVQSVVLMGRTAHGTIFSRPSAADRVIAARMLERLGIAHLADRPYTKISGGERQLTLLARALAQEPQFVVLDEPTASLDYGNQGRVMQEIRALALRVTGCSLRRMTRITQCAPPFAPGKCIADGEVRAVLNRARLEALYGVKLSVFRDRDSGETAFLPG
jgi:iron complex transport system ATP-binding protein